MSADLLRRLGNSGLRATPLGMGCWPITGITSVDVTPEASRATLHAARDAGITFFDTAHCYGYDGESERLIAQAFGPRRDGLVIASKGGIHWEQGKQVKDGSPATLRRECAESLRRLHTDRIDLYYLHAPDPAVPVAESAGALAELIQRGDIGAAGISNCTTAQLAEFASVCPLTAYQPHYNMLQREIELDQLPWCVAHDVAVVVYWPLMKGLLAGKLPRDHVFAAKDGRQKYPMFRDAEWERNQDFLAALRPIAAEAGKTVSQLVLAWTIQRPGITAALCGAKRPEQIAENAGGMGWELTADQLARIDAALAARGPAASRGAV